MLKRNANYEYLPTAQDYYIWHSASNVTLCFQFGDLYGNDNRRMGHKAMKWWYKQSFHFDIVNNAIITCYVRRLGQINNILISKGATI